MKNQKHIPPSPPSKGGVALAIALLLGVGTLQNAHADLNDGLVAHWSFDDCKATDNSGNGHDGTPNGNPQCVDGVKGKAFSFDGVQDFVEIQNMATDMKKGFSISSWITTDANVENHRVIVSKGKKETGHYEIYIEPNHNAALIGEFRFYSPDMIKSSNDDVHIKGDLGSIKVVNDNKPHALFVSNDGDITKFFVDGVLVHEEKTTGFLNDSSDNQLFIARQVDDGQMFFKGVIDDLRIYNRALTEAEVLELYNGVEKPKETVQISGQIKLGSQAGKGVSLSGDGLAESCLTDANGKFNCKITKSWTGFLTPESKGVSFSPPKISVTDAQTNLEVKTPLVGTTTDSFPLNGVMTSDWVKLKTDKATWQVEISTGASDDKTAYEGRFSFGSAKIGANQTAAIETTINVTQAGQLSFARRVSSNPEHGVLNFEISGKQKNGTWKKLVTEKWSGEVPWELKNYNLSVGQFKLRWMYVKDSAEAKGEDKAWIDAVSYPSSVKVAAKTCEGITAGTVKLMTIKNPTCDQLQAYRVWSTLIRPAKLAENDHWKADLDTVEARNQLWEKRVKIIFSVVAFGQGNYSLHTGDAVGGVTTALGKSLDFLCNGVFDDPVNQSLCGVSKDVAITILDGYFQKLATGQAATYGWGAAPDIIEKAITIGYNLRDAWDADEIAMTLNNTNLADDFLDEYYKGGSNDAALKAMAKKYGATNNALSTVIDALAKQKGYYNGWADSLTWSFYGNEYDNKKIVDAIQGMKTLNQLAVKNFLKK